MKIKGLFLGLLLAATPSFAQRAFTANDSTEVLATVVLTDAKLESFSVGQTLQQFGDSVLTYNAPSLITLLEYNTPIYFKQNGLGMVSSPSFRGTTASQTAVLWNGININSNFNGQTDFSTVNAGVYDQVAVRAGGGSLVYGSGAIGGTVHLNTSLEFDKPLSNQVYLGYGSFNTLDARYHVKYGTEKWSFNFAATRNSSDNDYEFQMRDGQNTNGQFYNTSANLAIGWKPNTRNKLAYYGEIYDGKRHFPIYYGTEIRTKYGDFNFRNLLEWETHFGRFTSNLKTAFLREHYEYYPDIDREKHSFGKATTVLGKYDLSFKPTSKTLLNASLSHRYTEGQGSDVQADIRNISSLGLLFKHQLIGQLKYQIGVRKEITNAYESPFLYALGIAYQPTSFYTIKLSTSKNFRRPTFNDLYWTQSGNPDLRAEESQQVELGNSFKFKSVELTLTAYFNDIEDMIHWLPTSSGLFAPVNEDHVQTYGFEGLLNWHKQFGEHQVGVAGTYAYTISENVKTHKQLIYVPYHKATLNGTYGYKQWRFNVQTLYNGEVFLHSDNAPQYKLPGYFLVNAGLSYTLGKKNTYELGVQVRNIFNKAYANVKRYELPGTNFNFYINLNI